MTKSKKRREDEPDVEAINKFIRQGLVDPTASMITGGTVDDYRRHKYVEAERRIEARKLGGATSSRRRHGIEIAMRTALKQQRGSTTARQLWEWFKKHTSSDDPMSVHDDDRQVEYDVYMDGEKLIQTRFLDNLTDERSIKYTTFQDYLTNLKKESR